MFYYSLEVDAPGVVEVAKLPSKLPRAISSHGTGSDMVKKIELLEILNMINIILECKSSHQKQASNYVFANKISQEGSFKEDVADYNPRSTYVQLPLLAGNAEFG